ncbi:MAG: glycogen/starch synthase [Parachlamydiales bacterium]|nr:glycogen/starch synthase [Parachlamydiales bacterium]
MRIVHLAAEFAPIAKAGGLGEVLLGLTREVSKKGLDVEVILPKYDLIDLSKVQNLSIEVPNFKCLDSQNAVWSCRYEECQLRLLESRHPAGYFHRGKIYGCEDDIARFTYFSRAALEYLALQNKPIDVLHLHDWHVALCAPMVRHLFTQLRVKSIVLSIHNIEYQGKCAVSDLDRIGLKGDFYLAPHLLQDDNPKHPKTINLLKGGLVFSDALIPVSPTYAQEILTPQYGGGLDGTLRKLKPKIFGILNGIDQKIWDPEKDPALSMHYSTESVAKGKQAARAKIKLDGTKRPWIGAITRLVVQKGPELLEEAIETTLKLGGSYALLGSSPHPKMQEHFNQLKKKYEGNARVLFQFEYNEQLAHELYAALDLLLVPSHYEPCGLTQMIAMRYGTVPIVRSTGGLKDTVFDAEDSSTPAVKRNGFVFRDATKASMNQTLKRAFELFNSDPVTFQTLIRRGMQTDFSWKNPTLEYIKLYRTLLKSALDVNPIRINVVAN